MVAPDGHPLQPVRNRFCFYGLILICRLDKSFIARKPGIVRLQEGGTKMKTYLTIYVSSEGAAPSEVVERLTRMGFKPLTGPYDFVYEWNENGSTQDAIEVANQVHATLKGCKVIFKLETLPSMGED
jgi:hypothetical protein